MNRHYYIEPFGLKFKVYLKKDTRHVLGMQLITIWDDEVVDIVDDKEFAEKHAEALNIQFGFHPPMPTILEKN